MLDWFETKQDKVIDGPREMKVLKIGSSGLNRLINPMISRYDNFKQLLQKVFNDFLP